MHLSARRDYTLIRHVKSRFPTKEMITPRSLSLSAFISDNLLREACSKQLTMFSFRIPYVPCPPKCVAATSMSSTTANSATPLIGPVISPPLYLMSDWRLHACRTLDNMRHNTLSMANVSARAWPYRRPLRRTSFWVRFVHLDKPNINACTTESSW